MTIGTGYEGPSDLALTLNAAADRQSANAASAMIEASPALQMTTGLDPSDGVNHTGGSSFGPGMPLMPSSAGLVGAINASQVEAGIRDWDGYTAIQNGVPWPPRAPGYTLEPTVASRRGDIYEGWNAASQPGAAPGMGFAEINVGAMSYEEAMNWSPAPMTDNLGALRTNFREPRGETRPGFGAAGGGNVVVPFVLLLGFGLWALSRMAQEEEG
jgi:hypothetical protein